MSLKQHLILCPQNPRPGKINEKYLLRLPECLIVDSLCYMLHGEKEKQYTNTILVTSKLAFWKTKVKENFSGDYTIEERDLSHGEQVVYKDCEGEKFLTFSFYPSRNKMMVQGNHKDLKKWISIFKQHSQLDRTSTVPAAAAPSVADMPHAKSKGHASETSQPEETTIPSHASAVQDTVNLTEENDTRASTDTEY